MSTLTHEKVSTSFASTPSSPCGSPQHLEIYELLHGSKQHMFLKVLTAKKVFNFSKRPLHASTAYSKFTILKVIWVCHIFAGSFCKSKREHLWNKEKCFLFHFKSSFHSWNNQILTFQIFKCHDIIKCLNMKHGIQFTE